MRLGTIAVPDDGWTYRRVESLGSMTKSGALDRTAADMNKATNL